MMPHEKDELLTLLESKHRWCQHVEARDQRGRPVHYNDEKAAAWDVVGAMCLLFGWERACELFVQVGRHLTGRRRSPACRNREMSAMASLQDFNDLPDTTYDLIMARLREVRVYSRAPTRPVGHETVNS